MSVGVSNTLQMRKTNLPPASPELDVLPVWGSGLIAGGEGSPPWNLRWNRPDKDEWGGGALQAWPARSCLQAPFSPPWGPLFRTIFTYLFRLTMIISIFNLKIFL